MNALLILVALLAAAAVGLLAFAARTGAVGRGGPAQLPGSAAAAAAHPVAADYGRYAPGRAAPVLGTAGRAHRSSQSAGQDFVLSPEELYGARIVSAAVASTFLLLTIILLGRFESAPC